MKQDFILTAHQQKLVAVWQEHTHCEFETKDVKGTLATMCEGAHIINVPTLTGGVGLTEIQNFYTHYFIPQLPPDTQTVLVSRTVGHTQIVDELIFKFTHTISMEWILPDIEPTNKPVEIALVVIIGFCDDKVLSEHIYWDQASVLVQIGLLNPTGLPVNGVASARKIKNSEQYAINQSIKKI